MAIREANILPRLRLHRKGLVVCLSVMGCDETFCGNIWHCQECIYISLKPAWSVEI